MKIYSLRKEEFELVRRMDPEGLLKRLELPHYFALVGCLDGPAALVIASAKRKELAIEWIYVAPDYRRNKVASELVKYLAAHSKGRELAAHLIRYSGKDADREGAEDFFSSLGMSETKDACLRRQITKKEIMQNPFFDKGASRLSNVHRLTELPAYMRQTAVKDFTNKPNSITALLPPDVYVAYDPALSCAVMADGEPAGSLLLKRAGHLIYPVCVYAKRPNHATNMFRFAEDLLSGEDDYTLCIDTSEPRAVKLVHQIFGMADSPEEGRVWK